MKNIETNDFNFFADLPREITIDIISRLPIRSIINFKLVSRVCRDAAGCREFIQFHLSKPDQHLIVFSNSNSNPNPWYKIWRFEGENNVLDITLNKSILADYEPIHSPANGLILMRSRGSRGGRRRRGINPPPWHLIICNPITREYIRLPDLPENHDYDFGFGVSATTHQYKVVGIFQSICQVYTLGTGKWRSISAGSGFGSQPEIRYKRDPECALVDGNLHWLDVETDRIFCFNLETEVFTTFSLPPHGPRSLLSLSVLDNCLCVCDGSLSVLDTCMCPYEEPWLTRETEIWLMRNGRNWNKEFVFSTKGCSDDILPIKVLNNSDVLVTDRHIAVLFYYSNKRRKRVQCKTYTSFSPSIHFRTNTLLYTPSFLRLKTLLLEEEVRSF